MPPALAPLPERSAPTTRQCRNQSCSRTPAGYLSSSAPASISPSPTAETGMQVLIESRHNLEVTLWWVKGFSTAWFPTLCRDLGRPDSALPGRAASRFDQLLALLDFGGC